ncbi:unnamed protein product [Didymodactylos carnosus]|uniref:mitogen-activated protein kinase kinase n=1 Tax=Didymodactylos carnosus TaxID=1234261 RepID=A0A814P341_9BILA|nr:unnamed protein product [Didymodactylos carnosus]CAF3865112.1 unnamed protein product [Didymodactylos carnosus]
MSVLCSPVNCQLEVQATACINYNGEIVHNISADMLEDIKTLGKGRYGTVTLVQIAKYPHIRMAAKRMTLETDASNRAPVITDLRTMKAVGSEGYPYITKFYAALIDTVSELVICMEALDTSVDKLYRTIHQSKELELLRSKENKFKHLLNLLLYRLVHNIVHALDFLKQKQIIHRDVKPQNILEKNPQLRPQSYNEILQISIIHSESVEPTAEEIDFITEVISFI